MKGQEFMVIGMCAMLLFFLGMVAGAVFFPYCEPKESPCDLIENETMKCVNVMNDYCRCDIVECFETEGYTFCIETEEDIIFDIDKLSD